ncbi:MAG: KH domain-containing protein [Candidatus Pacebacteria bacterium]|nr:KH domain-containing protein [Candidatus Paceibacterota bacterium]
MEQDREFLEYVVKALVDNPDDVKIDRVVDEMGVLLTLNVNPADMGKIIGRSGNTAKAIRTLLRVVGMKNDARVNLKINEPAGGTGGREGGSATKTVDEAMEGLDL